MQPPKKVPLRRCVGCQSMFAKRDLIRIVSTQEGEIQLDPTGKRNGRGAYLCKNLACLQLARKRKSLERALKTSIPGPLFDDLAERLKEASPVQ